jgi:hypothetical protein
MRTDHRRFNKTSLVKEQDDECFVYLLPLHDGQGFKVGYSAKPLQRFETFSWRYFELFDLEQAQMLQVRSRTEARAIERRLKNLAKPFGAARPPRVIPRCGEIAQTEWFLHDAMLAVKAELAAISSADSMSVLYSSLNSFVRNALLEQRDHLQRWAIDVAAEIADREAYRGHWCSTWVGRKLRASLDACEHFGVALLPDDPELADFVRSAANKETR